MQYQSIKPSRLSQLQVALLAAVIYGSWAAYSNIEYTSQVMIRAGLGQGLYAFFSTWLVSYVAVTVHRKITGDKMAIAIAFMASFFVMLWIPITIHTLLKTPDMWQAITPGLIWGSGYIAALLWHSHATI